LIFALSSAGIVALSRRSLRDTHSHGYYRFFAFEAMAGLVALNLKDWFRNPFGGWQLVSWPLLASSAGLAAHGFRLLRVVGKPRPGQAYTETLLPGFEDTSELVTVGAYRYIRHPMYASLLAFCWGAFFKGVSWRGALLSVLATVSLVSTAQAEEAENRRRFGQPYVKYSERTRLFVPFVF
jgi:hypothetical protein